MFSESTKICGGCGLFFYNHCIKMVKVPTHGEFFLCDFCQASKDEILPEISNEEELVSRKFQDQGEPKVLLKLSINASDDKIVNELNDQRM